MTKLTEYLEICIQTVPKSVGCVTNVTVIQRQSLALTDCARPARLQSIKTQNKTKTECVAALDRSRLRESSQDPFPRPTVFRHVFAMVICTFFLNNCCRYGNQCKKEHIDVR